MAHIWVWQEEQAEAFFAEARKVLRSRGVLALPTETFYALAVNPFDPAALTRLFALKARPEAKPALVLIAGPEMLFQVVRGVPAAALPLMAAFWPGPLTLIFPARLDLPPLLTGGTGTVGLRQPRQDLVCRLMAALGLPLTGTSANRSGQEPLTTAAAVARSQRARISPPGETRARRTLVPPKSMPTTAASFAIRASSPEKVPG